MKNVNNLAIIHAIVMGLALMELQVKMCLLYLKFGVMDASSTFFGYKIIASMNNTPPDEGPNVNMLLERCNESLLFILKITYTT